MPTAALCIQCSAKKDSILGACPVCRFQPQLFQHLAWAHIYSSAGMTADGLDHHAKAKPGNPLQRPPDALEQKWAQRLTDAISQLSAGSAQPPSSGLWHGRPLGWWNGSKALPNRMGGLLKRVWPVFLLAGIVFALIGFNNIDPTPRGLPPTARAEPVTMLNPAPASSVPESWSPPPPFTAPAQPLPENGFGENPFNKFDPATLDITTPDGEENYYIRVKSVEDQKVVSEFFIRAGQTFTTHLPLGRFKLICAVGKKWYGKQFLFGPDTRYDIPNKIFRLQASDHLYLSLTKQLGGNLEMRPAGPTDW